MINVLDLAPRVRIDLLDGRQVTVEENMNDGQWVSVREDGAADVELIHSQDILRLVQE
jgi:hypothetical protein